MAPALLQRIKLLTNAAAHWTVFVNTVMQAVLDCPQGVINLMNLLADSHEVVRNEALLLLVALAHASPEVRQIAASEGAFERLLIIMQYVPYPIW